MGREGIEGYSDKTGGRVEINPEDRHGGPIASESALSPSCSAEEQSGSWCLGETYQGCQQRLGRDEGKLPEQFERKMSLADRNGCALNALVRSAALGFTAEMP